MDAKRSDLATFVVEPEVLAIGVLEGDEREVFGEIGGVASDSNGVLYVIDFLGKQLRAYSPRGLFVDQIGQEGEGPGELKWPSHVEVLRDGTIGVLDEAQMKMAFFTLQQGELRHVRDLRLPLMARSFCEVDSGFLVLGLHEHKILHMVHPDGSLANSFGSAEGVPPGISERWTQSFEDTSASGEMVCLQSLGMVVVLPSLLPEIRAFDLNGDSLWTLELTDYHRTTPRETERGTLQYGYDPQTGKAQSATSLLPISETQLIAQFAVMERWEFPDQVPVQSRIIDLTRPSSEILPVVLPRLSHVTRNRIVGWETLPYPKVRVYARSNDG